MSNVTLSIALNYGGPKRKMTVVRSPGSYDCPMVRISNRLLTTAAGFHVGTPVEVSYQQGAITITKIKS